MVRIELGQSVGDSVAAISRAYEGFVSSRGRIGRRSIDDDSPKLRDVVAVRDPNAADSSVARFDTSASRSAGRVPVEAVEPAAPAKPEDPRAKELSRRRKAARKREREGHSKASGAAPRDEFGLELLGPRAALQREGDRFDRMMILMLIGAGVLAVLAAFGLSA